MKIPKTWWGSAFSIPNRLKGHRRRENKTLWIVSYDICDARRLRKAASKCLDFGARQQNSVYECYLTPIRFEKLIAQLETILEPSEDSLVCYPIHANFLGRVRIFGQANPPKLKRKTVF